MDNDKKLFEELLKTDGIDPKAPTESEREAFKKMLDSEQKRLNRLSWISAGAMWIFALVLIGMCLFQNLLENLRIPSDVGNLIFFSGALVIMVAMLFVMIKYMPSHNRKLRESGKKVQKLYYLVHGKHKGVVMVGKKDGKRHIYWLHIIMIAAGVWLVMSLGGAGVWYLLCQGWLYSSPPWEHIFFCTICSLSLVISGLYTGLKAPLDELIEIKPKEPRQGGTGGMFRTIMHSKMAKFAVAVIIIAAISAVIYFSVFSGSGQDQAPKVASKQVKEVTSKGAIMQPVLLPPGPDEIQLDRDLNGHKLNRRMPEDGWIQIGSGIFWYYNGGIYLNFTQQDVRVYVTADDQPRQLAGLRFSKPEDIEQLHLALNELTEPTILWCECPLPDEFSGLPNLHMIIDFQRVKIRRRPVKLSDISPLSGLTGLTSLDLSGCDQLTDLSPLANLTNLTSLDLAGCSKIADLSPLADLVRLELLDISAWDSDTPLNDISPLANLTALKSLNLRSRTNLSDLTPLGELAELESLDLEGSSRQKSDLTPLVRLAKLKSLKIGGLWNVEDLSPLGELTSLEFLKLGSANSRVSDISFLAGLTKLDRLELSQWFGVSDLTPLANLTNLTQLRIHRFTKVSDITPLGKLTNLQSLDLESCKKISDLSPLANLAKLESLDLCACKSVSDLSPLANLAELKEVRLQFCTNVTDLSPLRGAIRQGADIKINTASGSTNADLTEQLSEIKSQQK